MVRPHGRRRRQPRRRRARPQPARRPAAPRRCPSRSSCAATSPASRRRRCGSRTPRAPARSTATTSRTGCARTRRCPQPIVTPTTKPPAGSTVHDEPLTWAEVVERGLVDAGRWEQVTAVALELFRRGQEVAGGRRADPRRHEVRVRPDRRRRAAADRRGAHARLVAVLGGRHLRRAAGRRRGAGEPRQGGRPPGPRRRRVHAATASSPSCAPDVWSATSSRYIDAYERLTGQPFEPGAYPVEARIAARLDELRETWT